MSDNRPSAINDPANIAENIRFLVSLMPSISEAAARIGINRQQLNKYLNRTSVPSLRTMRRIAAAFDVSAEALTHPPYIFQRDRRRDGQTDSDLTGNLLARRLKEVSTGSANALTPYSGRYFRYTFVPTKPDVVLRSYVVIFQRDGNTFAQVLERFGDSGAPWKRKSVRKSLHLLTYLQDRIQCIEVDALNDDLSPGCSIFYPVYSSGVNYLSGITLGSFRYGMRPIYSSSIVLESLPGSRNRRNDLLACGLMPVEELRSNTELCSRMFEEDGSLTMKIAR